VALPHALCIPSSSSYLSYEQSHPYKQSDNIVFTSIVLGKRVLAAALFDLLTDLKSYHTPREPVGRKMIVTTSLNFWRHSRCNELVQHLILNLEFFGALGGHADERFHLEETLIKLRDVPGLLNRWCACALTLPAGRSEGETRILGLWGAKSPSAGFVIDNREPSPSATAGLGGGVGCFTFSSGPFWRL
jgi:hypothetical protein